MTFLLAVLVALSIGCLVRSGYTAGAVNGAGALSPALVATAAAMLASTGMLVACGSSEVGGSASVHPVVTGSTISSDQQPIEVDAAGAHLSCRGDGSVPVVFMAGGTDRSTEWDELRRLLGDDARTCVFERQGLVPSDEPPDEPLDHLTPDLVAESLDATLTAAAVDGPVVVVAHSISGLVLRRFGTTHPERVAGAIFLDPTTSTALTAIAADLKATGWDVEETTAQTHEPAEWPEVPLVVLSRDPALLTLGDATIEDLWATGQQEYASLTPDGEQRSVPGADHYVHRAAPDVVVTTIRQIVATTTA